MGWKTKLLILFVLGFLVSIDMMLTYFIIEFKKRVEMNPFLLELYEKFGFFETWFYEIVMTSSLALILFFGWDSKKNFIRNSSKIAMLILIGSRLFAVIWNLLVSFL